jgi:hypothetical protein
MPRLYVDLDPPREDALGFTTDTADLVYFLSWAFATRFGANHEMSIAALVLRGEFKIDLSPLLTFADRAVEDPDDAEALERAWQDPEPLAECCEQIAKALASRERRLNALQEEYPALAASIEELGRLARWAAEHETRVRLSYEMEGVD